VTFSHSGEFMAMTTPTGELQIWSVKDNAQVSTIPTGPTGYFLWSPDDRHIFWAGNPSGIADAGPEPAPVSADTGEGGLSAAWSMDGKSIVYDGGDGMYSIDPDSGAKTLLYAWPAGLTPLPDAPRLSADGKHALVSARDVTEGSFRAIIVPLDGSTQGVQVTSVWPGDAVWSPSDNVLAVVGDWCQAASHLLLLNADGSVRSMFDGATQIPAFSVDGSAIAYVGPDPAGGKDEGLVVRDVAGGSVTSFLPGFLRSDIWSPDGRWIAYTPGSLTYQCIDVSGRTQVLPFP
jgi:Tol biopolymer transport system component